MISIRSQIALIFMLAVTPLVLTSTAVIVLSRSMIVSSRAVFDNNAMLESIDRNLGQADGALREFLNLRSHETLRDFYRATYDLSVLAEQLPRRAPATQRQISLFMVRRLLENYLSIAEQTVSAGRGRLITDSARLYRQSAEIKELMSLLVTTHYWDDVRSGLSGFREFSTAFTSILVEGMIWFASITLLAVVFIGIVIGRVADPIHLLSEKSSRVASGEFSIPDIAVPGAAREIVKLTESFNMMKHSIARYIDELNKNADVERKLMEQNISYLEMKSALRSAELIALQSQINPHFLYNTLNTAMQLSVVENAERTTEYLDRLGEAYRYLLSNPETPVPLADELAALENYIYVLRVRFGSRIEFVTNVESGLPQLHVPPLILQPLVENAVLHGLKNLETGGVVEITVGHQSDAVVVSVADNGCGIHEARLEQLVSKEFHIERSRTHQGEGERGLGLANVIERLKHFFEADDLVEILSAPGQGTTVRLKLPLSPELSRSDESAALPVSPRRGTT